MGSAGLSKWSKRMQTRLGGQVTLLILGILRDKTMNDKIQKFSLVD